MSKHVPRHRTVPLDEIENLDELLARGGTVGDDIAKAARRAWRRLAHRHPPGRHRLNGGPPDTPEGPTLAP